MSDTYIKLKIRRGNIIPTNPALEQGELFYKIIQDENNVVTNSELYIGKGGGNYAKVGADFSYIGDGVTVSGNTITIPGYQFSGDAVTTSGTSVTINHQTVSELFNTDLPVEAGTYYLAYDEENEQWSFATVQNIDTNHFVTGGSWSDTGSGALTLNVGSGAQSDVIVTGITGYSNSSSGLTATTFQAAIDEVDSNLDAVKANSALVTYDGTASGLSATNVKTAIDEVKSDLTTEINDVTSDLNAVTAGTTNIAFDNTTSQLNATNIKDAIDEVDGDLDNVIAGTTNITFSDSDLSATTVSAAISELADDVIVLQGQTAEIGWKKVAEINDTANTLTINSVNLGEAFNIGQDYKFVVDAQTNDTDTTGTFSIQLDGDSTAGRHSSIRHITEMDNNGASETRSGNDGSTGTLIDTGLTLNTGTGTQGTQTVLHSEFIVSPAITFSDNEGLNLDVHPYIVEGSGSVVAVEAANQSATAVSYTRMSRFTGGFAKVVAHDAARNLTSVVLSNLPNAGGTDNVKVRVYKRER